MAEQPVALHEYGARLPEGQILVTGVGDAGRASAIGLVGNPAGPYVGGAVMERELRGHGWMPDAGARLHVARVLVEAGRQALQLAADQWGTELADADCAQKDEAKALDEDLRHVSSIVHHLGVQADRIRALPLRRLG